MSASCSDNDMDLKQKVISLVRRFEAKDIVEHETTHLPGYVTVTIKFKKDSRSMAAERAMLEGIFTMEKAIKEREKASNSDKDDKDKSEQVFYSEIQLTSMTKNQLFDMLTAHGKKVSNKKILKSNLAKLIIREGFNKPHDDNEASLLLS